jgi:cell division septum initiation protein DivIVA
MDSGIVLHESADEQELRYQREELARLEATLIDRELFLSDLKARLAAFQGRYLREVGVLYAELDEWTAKLAELAAEVSGTEQARVAASEARARAEESYSTAHGEAANNAAFSPSPDTKRLYRQILRQIHPDYAVDDADRALCTRLTAKARVAYERSDQDALRRILEEYKSSPESVKGQGVVADLERVLRQIERITKRLTEIEAEISELTSSDLAMLMAKVESAADGGHDLLAEMAMDVTKRIQAARGEFEAQSSKLGAQ